MARVGDHAARSLAAIEQCPCVAFPRPFELGAGSKLFFVGYGTAEQVRQLGKWPSRKKAPASRAPSPLLILAVLGSNNLPEIRQSLREWEARRVVEGIS